MQIGSSLITLIVKLLHHDILFIKLTKIQEDFLFKLVVTVKVRNRRIISRVCYANFQLMNRSLA